MKTKTWIFLIAALLMLCVGMSLLLLQPGKADYAKVYSCGELLYILDLRIDTIVTVEADSGTNTITVRNGKVAVTAANCPDGYCMARGYCSGGAQIVCLPNRLVIQFFGTQKIDSIVG